MCNMGLTFHFVALLFISKGHVSTTVLPFCGNCVNEPATDYTGTKVTTGVLWTDPNIQSLIECASRSFLFPSIKSYGYSEKTRECVAYIVPLSMNPVSEVETGFNMFSTCAPVDGGFTPWTSWGPSCTATCGPSLTMMMTRTRSCTNPPPENGGADCTGDTSETAEINCGLPECQVNGVWGSWSGWSSCSATCDTSATRSRSRSCNNPPPSNGGANCPGSSSDSLSCGNNPCPVMDSTFGSCTTTCSGTNIVCEQGQCVCDIFYNYQYGSCVQGCSSYSTSFTSFYDKVLNGYNDRIVSNVMSLLECKNLCIAESSFLCVTADWEKNAKDCYLSKTTWFGASSGRSTSTSYYQLIRNCA